MFQLKRGSPIPFLKTVSLIVIGLFTHHEKCQKTPSRLQEKPSNQVSRKNASVKSCFAKTKTKKKIQILLTFRKTYKIKTIITEMYLNILPDITLMCCSRYNYSWLCFGNFRLSSRRSFLVLVTEEKL